MKVKLLKRLRKEAKEEIYLSPSYSEEGKLCIIHEIPDAPFGSTILFYDNEMDIFCTDTIFNYNSVIEALPDLARARRYYILNVLHSDYRSCSKGQEKRNEIEKLKRENYQKYLQQF